MRKKIIIMTLLVSLVSTPLIASADAFKVVTFGKDLTDQQEEVILKEFNVKRKEVNTLEVNKDMEVKYLGGVVDDSKIGTKSYSSSFVEPTGKGGLNISVSDNIYWVSEGMYRNALITAGITNANVKISAPLKVSGTSALVGIIHAFENSEGGATIDEDKKEVANKELAITGQIGDIIGDNNQAANIINNIKIEIIQKSPKTDAEISAIVDKIVQKELSTNLLDSEGNGITLDKAQTKDIKVLTKDLMKDINSLDIEYKDVSSSLTDAKNKLSQEFKNIGANIKTALESEESKTFFSKIGEFFSNMFSNVRNFFTNIFEKDDSTKVLDNNVVDESTTSNDSDVLEDNGEKILDAVEKDSDTTEVDNTEIENPNLDNSNKEEKSTLETE